MLHGSPNKLMNILKDMFSDGSLNTFMDMATEPLAVHMYNAIIHCRFLILNINLVREEK